MFSILSNVQTVFQSAAFSFSQPPMWTLQVPSLRLLPLHCNSLLISDDLDQAMFFYEGLLASVSWCEPSFHFLFPKRWCFGVNVTEEELKNRTGHRLWYSLQESSVKWTFSALFLITSHHHLRSNVVPGAASMFAPPSLIPANRVPSHYAGTGDQGGREDKRDDWSRHPSFLYFFGNQNFETYSPAMHGGSGLP